MTRVFKIADARGIRFGVPPCNAVAAVGRAVIHEQQFPVGVGLGEHARDGLLEEGRFIEEDDNHGDESAGTGHGSILQGGTVRARTTRAGSAPIEPAAATAHASFSARTAIRVWKSGSGVRSSSASSSSAAIPCRNATAASTLP